MARKPNYKFERMERERAKSAKKAARLEAKKEKAELRKAGVSELDAPDLDVSGGSAMDAPADTIPVSDDSL